MTKTASVNDGRSALLVRIDIDLHRQLKMFAAASGETIRDLVEEAIRQRIKKPRRRS